MKKPFLKTKSVLYSWLLSYILVMVIIIIIFSFVYIKSINAIENETDKVYMASLKQMQQAIDNILYNTELLSVKISMDNRVNSLIYLRNPLNEEDIIKIVETIDDLKKFQVSNYYVKNIFIYMKNSDFIISSTAKYEPKNFFNFYYQKFGIAYDEWVGLIKKKYSLEYIMLPNPNKDNETGNTVLFMHSIPMYKNNGNDALLVIEVDKDAILNSVNGLQWISNATAFIQDENNNTISTRDFVIHESLRYENLGIVEGSFKVKINNENSIITHIKSTINDWKYVCIIPASIFLEQVEYIYKVFFISTFVCIMIGGILAYLIAKSNYIPVNKIINIIKKSGIGEKCSSNEYDFIENSVMDIIEEKENIRNKLKQQSDILKNNFLARLIKGRVKQEIDVDYILDAYGVNLKSNYFGIVSFFIEHFDDLYNHLDDADKVSSETIDTVYYIIKKVFTDKLEENYDIEISLVDDIPICLISTETCNDNTKLEIHRTIEDAKKTIESQYGIYLSISISNLHSLVENIPKAYQEALEVMEYKMLVGINRVITYDDIFVHSNNYEQGSYSKKEQQFRNCVIAGDYKSARTVLTDMFRSYFTKNKVSIQIAKCRMFGLINIMLNKIEEVSTDLENQYVEYISTSNVLFNSKTIKELESNMLLLLEKIENYLDNKKVETQNETINEIIAFVHENKSNENLSVSMVAERFEMSVINLSKFFKKQTGTGMLDYITQLRIDMAKELLLDENLSVNEIGRMVGYINSATFIRVFKKYQDITPGKFREASDEFI